MKCSLGISHFLTRSPFFPILLFSCISLHCSLRKIFLSLLAIPLEFFIQMGISFLFLLYLLLLFFSQLFVRPPQTTILLFLHFKFKISEYILLKFLVYFSEAYVWKRLKAVQKHKGTKQRFELPPKLKILHFWSE